MKPGRNVAIHCMDVIRFAGSHGVRHTYDYPSDLAAGLLKSHETVTDVGAVTLRICNVTGGGVALVTADWRYTVVRPL